MSVLKLTCAVALVCFSTLVVRAADEKKDVKLMCPVSGRAIDQDQSVTHNGAKVYFCCPNCKAAFEKDAGKFVAKANHQIALSGQAKQAKCVFTGGKLNPDTEITVNGAKVQFCCNNCKGKATAAKGDEQITLLFDDAAFKKGYEVEKK